MDEIQAANRKRIKLQLGLMVYIRQIEAVLNGRPSAGSLKHFV
jgi:hypothetical protein